MGGEGGHTCILACGSPRTNVMELVLLVHLYWSSRDWTQGIKLAL